MQYVIIEQNVNFSGLKAESRFRSRMFFFFWCACVANLELRGPELTKQTKWCLARLFQDNVFLLLRSRHLMEFRIEGKESREYSSATKVNIEVLIGTNRSLNS